MIYLLGGSGYVGNACKACFKRKGISFRSLSRSEVDYTNLNTLTAALRAQKPESNSISELQEFVEASLLCWERRVPFGIYNITNPGTVTTREVVDLIRKSGACDREFDFFSSEDEFMRAAAKTPRSNCVMNSDKIRSVGIRITEVHEALERDLRNWTKCGLADGPSLDTQNQPLKPRLTMQRGAETNFMA